MNSFVEAALKRPAAVMLFIVLVLMVGMSSYLSMPRESSPDVRIPIIYVSMRMEGISPADGERLLVRPMEKELKTIEGVKEMTAKSLQGFSSVTLEFQAGFDNVKALQDVREKVDAAKAELPQDADEPTVTEVTFSLFPVVNVILTGQEGDLGGQRQLLRIARDLRDRLEGLAGVLDVEIGGDREEAVEIIVDPLIMQSYSVIPADLYQKVLRNNQVIAAGSMDNEAGMYAIEIPGLIEGLKELRDIPVKLGGDGAKDAVVKLGDLTEIRRTFKDPEGFARVNGKPAVVLEVKKRVGANIIETIDEVKAEVFSTMQFWPSGVSVIIAQDNSDEIRDMVNDLQNNLVFGTLLVMLVIILFLGTRSAILVGVAVPLSFFMGIICLALLGVTLNIVVLFSLILVVGMLVDDAIVVNEYADRLMVGGMSKQEAFPAAAKRMMWPVMSSNIIPIIVFLPLLFWPGVVGQFMMYMPITVVFTVAASAIAALILVPALGMKFGGIGKVDNFDEQVIKASESGDWSKLGKFSKLYAEKLMWMLERPKRIVAATFGLLLLVYGYFGVIGTGLEFFPDIEPKNTIVQIRAQGNMSTLEKDAVTREVESRIKDMVSGGELPAPSLSQAPEIRVSYARSGAMGQRDTAPDTIGIITLELMNWQQRRKANDILDDIRARTADIPGVIIEARKEDMGPAQGKPIEIQFASRHPEILEQEFRKFKKAALEMGGFSDVEDNLPLPGIQWQMETDRIQAERYGTSVAEIGSMIKMITNGMKVGEYRPNDSDDEVDILARFPENKRTLSELERLRVVSSFGSIPVSNMVIKKPEQAVNAIDRSEGFRVLRFKADVAEGELADNKVNELRKWFESNPPDPRIMLSFKGEDEEMKETGSFLSKAFFLALLGMLMVFVIQFNSFKSALVVLSAVFLSTVGVLLGLAITGQPFGVVMCGLGIIALAGIVVKNNIIYLDTFDILRSEGFKYKDALVLAGVQRMRPILLTAFASVLGLLPMVYQLNIDFLGRDITVGAPSSQWWTQLSTSIAGGLSFATLLTLFFTPCLMMWLGRKPAD